MTVKNFLETKATFITKETLVNFSTFENEFDSKLIKALENADLFAKRISTKSIKINARCYSDCQVVLHFYYDNNTSEKSIMRAHFKASNVIFKINKKLATMMLFDNRYDFSKLDDYLLVRDNACYFAEMLMTFKCFKTFNRRLTEKSMSKETQLNFTLNNKQELDAIYRFILNEYASFNLDRLK